ncbi:MAG: NAD(P)-dependent alcohol dehydrogenase [Bacteroidales bacterium]|nr:NAD(P)-dependent alcohol dehydrogenase [Bacteroidales bacterium]
MKAAVINQFGEPGVFEIKDIPAPILKPNQILVKNFASSVNPIDWKQRKGNHKLFLGSPFPIMLGFDAAGIVEKVGAEVSKFKPGDRVCGVLSNPYGGAYGEFVKGAEKCFAILPESIDFETGAALSLAGLTALQGLRDKLNVQKGQKVLINGAAGGVGHITLQIANIMEAETIAVTSKPHFDMVNEYAPDEIIDYKTTNILESKDKYHHFFDAVGVYSFLKTHHVLLKGGTYLTTLPRPKLLLHKCIAPFRQGKKVKSLLMRHSSSDLELLISWVEKGMLKIRFDKQFTLDEISKAHQYAQLGKTEGKIVIKIR